MPTLAQQGRGADGFQRPLLRRIAVALLLLRVRLSPVIYTVREDRSVASETCTETQYTNQRRVGG